MNIRRQTIADVDKIFNILSHESVAPFLLTESRDTAYTVAKAFLLDSSVYVLSPEPQTCLVFTSRTNIALTVHMCAIDGADRARAFDSAKHSIRWIFDNTDYTKVVGEIEVSNRRAIMGALRCGFKKEGLLKEAILMWGKACDEVVVGITKTEFFEANKTWLDAHPLNPGITA